MVGQHTMTFPNHISGNEHGAFNGNSGEFIAPISGRYGFGLFFTVQGTPGSNYFIELYLYRNDKVQTILDISGVLNQSWRYDSRYVYFEIDLTQGQIFTVYNERHSEDGLEYSHITFLEGKLTKKF